ncbi:response regulator transcription factor [Sphingomonas floccifaciens]|uniref:Response regulator transcription factor n=1 Tax=Sphingomonas floccifaciens TaxID=1844115 RepID=A0ABW4NHC8_9SPHN
MRSVYVVDDDASIRRSTAFLVRSAGYLPRAFTSSADFLNEAPHLAPGVLLLDVRMPEIDGFGLVESLPAPLGDRFPIVMITGHGDLATAVQAMRHGVRDFLEKPYEDHELLDVVARLWDELDLQLPLIELRAAASEQIDRLADRERDVLILLSAGKMNKVVAHELAISVRTVEMHRAQMLERLGVRTLAEATRLAFAAGLIR